MCRERGLDSSWRHFFDVFSGPSFVPLVTLTVFLAVLFLLWLGAAWTIYQMTLGSLDPQSIGSFMSLLFTTPEGWTMIVGGNLVGLAFSALVIPVSAMSFPILVARRPERRRFGKECFRQG